MTPLSLQSKIGIRECEEVIKRLIDASKALPNINRIASSQKK